VIETVEALRQEHRRAWELLVGARHADPGGTVAPAAPPVTVADLTRLRIEAGRGRGDGREWHEDRASYRLAKSYTYRRADIITIHNSTSVFGRPASELAL
jgi:hypothetical protein